MHKLVFSELSVKKSHTAEVHFPCLDPCPHWSLVIWYRLQSNLGKWESCKSQEALKLTNTARKLRQPGNNTTVEVPQKSTSSLRLGDEIR